jgi:hypothetical protein
MGDGMAVAGLASLATAASIWPATPTPPASSGRMRHRPQLHGHFAIFLILSRDCEA